ncbi:MULTISPECIES: FAD-binding oxidoreductase [Rhodomicrobium]|uniref:FAD-binding oxidoreductase n=1 Tax=Rhodomicrobium TaxID=1068 RepID=UPI000B4B3419|nr:MULTISPECIES: FAD-binding oxidoreductase [Rhodomicrobium]
METTRLKARSGTPIGQEPVDAFRAEFKGQLILPGDAAYDTARRIWNASIDKRPGLIARCSGAADVVAAVKFARANDLLVAVRGGGHNVGGRATCDDGIVIDLSAMKGIIVDPRSRTVQAQAGATLAELDRETHLYGLAVPAGTMSKTGIAGLTLGGGVGWLVRKYGLSCDNVLSFEVVTAEGKLVTASPTANEDLYWGLRGGGGNFGIVTSFHYRAHPVSTVLGGLIIYPRDQSAAVVRNYREFMKTAPEELTAYAGFITTPDGMPAVGVVLCWCGDLAEGERVVKPLRSFGSPAMDAVQPMPFPVMQTLLDGAFPDGSRNYWKTAFLKQLSDEAIDTLIDRVNRAKSPMTGVVIEFYGGAPGRIGAGDTAYAQRGQEYNIIIAAQWADPAESELHTAWARDTFDAMQPFSSGGYLLNMMGEEKPEAIRQAFGGNYGRLVELKAKYDPTNFFSLNQNVAPPR